MPQLIGKKQLLLLVTIPLGLRDLYPLKGIVTVRQPTVRILILATLSTASRQKTKVAMKMQTILRLMLPRYLNALKEIVTE
jgi:hypothetical protein